MVGWLISIFDANIVYSRHSEHYWINNLLFTFSHGTWHWIHYSGDFYDFVWILINIHQLLLAAEWVWQCLEWREDVYGVPPPTATNKNRECFWAEKSEVLIFKFWIFPHYCLTTWGQARYLNSKHLTLLHINNQ